MTNAFDRAPSVGWNALAAILLVLAATHAQAATDTPSTSGNSDRRQIEEIVVTAERKEATVSDTSISITAFTGAMLENFGIRNQEDLQRFIPATVITPYDIAIRGVGRPYRALGGDPGVATYLNGVYSEDFGIASTENGLYDVERIEVLRGPQGTLYGRNAIGGAINFIDKRPTNEFQGEAHVLGGNYDLREKYGMVSGPLIDEVLAARLTGTKRTRDGDLDDKSGNQDPNSIGDENYALSLRWTPTENFELNTRGNERSSRRRMGGADGGGIVTLTENDGVPDPVTGYPRNTSTFAMGYRRVDDTVCPTLTTGRTDEIVDAVRVPGCRITTATLGYQNQPGSEIVYTFTDPITGEPVEAQRVTPGVDFSIANNAAFGTDISRQHMLGLGHLTGPDVSTDTSGHQDEYLDHQANSTDMRWTVNDALAIKYIFGYTDYFYDRTTDTDLTSNTDAYTLYSGDSQFYVSQEVEYVSHELQFFADFSDKLNTTSGLFYYTANITQRGDFYDSNGNGIYAQGFDYAAAGPFSFLEFFPKVGLFTAKQAGLARRNGVASGLSEFTDFGCGQVPWNGDPFEYCFGQWTGDTGGTNVAHGPDTAATSSEYQTRSEREAFAAYTQGVYTFNEQFALTLGVRWSRDQLDGEENYFSYTEATRGIGGDLPADFLTSMNTATGALAPDGAVLDYNQLRTDGIPASQSLWRQLHRKDDAVTWRVNLDWTPNDRDLVYLSVTTGNRSGGFALVFFSTDARSRPEDLTAYELGYKGDVLDGTMQINTSIYYYDYKHVQIFAATVNAIGDDFSQGAFSVPSGEVYGFEADVQWLASSRVTLGATFSAMHSEYTSNFYVIDTNNAQRPQSLFDPAATPFNLKGNQMLTSPDMNVAAYVQYAYPLSDYGTLTFLADYSWIDKVFFSPFTQRTDEAPAYSRTDLRLTWLSAEQNWTVAAFVDNAFDDIGIRQIVANGEGANFRRDGALTDPRHYGIEVVYRFGEFK